MKRLCNNRIALLLVLSLALAVNFTVGLKMGMSKPMTSDAEFYLLIAKSLAAGDGYSLREGFWPDTPTMTRSPAWPFAVSVGLRVCPGLSPDVVMRGLNLVLNSLVAVLVALLARRMISCQVAELLRESPEAPAFTASRTQQLGNSTTLFSILAGALYIVHPQALYLAYGGASEILFLVLSLTGTLLLLSQKQRVMSCSVAELLHKEPSSLSRNDPTTQQPNNSTAFPAADLGGFLLLGLACLVRPNFILWIVFFAGLVILRPRTGGVASALVYGGHYVARRGFARWLAIIGVGILIFLTPSLLWAVRNYQICGHFPVFSTLSGQTLYGGNNGIVANNLEQWGYWVFPNAIPGETPMVELSRRMSEYEVNDYYNRKGSEYIRTHLLEMPRLWLGKMLRAYWPLPWKATAGGLVAGVYRGLLYLAVVAGLIIGWRRLSRPYGVILTAMVLANIATVLIFWGCSRFAFAVEPFLIPVAVVALAILLPRPFRRLEHHYDPRTM